MAKKLHDLYEDSGIEIDDVGDEIDDLTDAVEDSEDIVNETINNTNEFVKDDGCGAHHGIDTIINKRELSDRNRDGRSISDRYNGRTLGPGQGEVGGAPPPAHLHLLW